VVAWLKDPLVVLGLLVLVAGLAWKHHLAARASKATLYILSPLAFSTLLRIFLLSVGLQHLEQPTSERALPPAGPERPGQPRVVWIIFDEMDYRLAFEERPAGLALPEFDRLRGESTCATNAFPPGDCTLYSMPALISGQRISTVKIKNYADLLLTRAENGTVASWSEMPSVFSSARELGVNTALVGWYHCYDRVLGGSLNYCAWHPFQMYESARAPQFDKAMLNQIGCLTGTLRARYIFVGLCKSCLEESLTVVTNSAYGLALLHLPPPHKPGVYDPGRDQYTYFAISKSKGYFNNLVLADRCLGTLRRTMEASSLWDRTWLIISADHSWRESRVYDGRRDLRVPFIIKSPKAADAVTYSPQLNTVLTHDLILAILRGEISGQNEVVAWLGAHGAAQPTVTAQDPRE
jgi:hypothetical protein